MISYRTQCNIRSDIKILQLGVCLVLVIITIIDPYIIFIFSIMPCCIIHTEHTPSNITHSQIRLGTGPRICNIKIDRISTVIIADVCINSYIISISYCRWRTIQLHNLRIIMHICRNLHSLWIKVD